MTCRAPRSGAAKRKAGAGEIGSTGRDLPCPYAGRPVRSLLKILLTNFCVYDCAHCVRRRSSNVDLMGIAKTLRRERARATADEKQKKAAYADFVADLRRVREMLDIATKGKSSPMPSKTPRHGERKKSPGAMAGAS
jgi:hypothetical protein